MNAGREGQEIQLNQIQGVFPEAAGSQHKAGGGEGGSKVRNRQDVHAPLGDGKEATLSCKKQSLPALGIKNMFLFWKLSWAGVGGGVGGVNGSPLFHASAPHTPWRTVMPASPGDRSAGKGDNEENHGDGCRIPSPSLFIVMSGERTFR